MRLISRLQSIIVVLLLVVLITACGSPTPPKTFAPDGKVVERAIALSLTQAQQNLSNQLTTLLPESEISKITVTQLEPLYLGKLPTYHLQGSYRVVLKLSDTKVEKQDNQFDIYLQRQIEGKTWRLLKKEPDGEQWLSYSLERF
ncbi:hypothetical protein [Gloeocapsa sp. PCC 73106]|uniref:hypothetical protein n=1 Tax=Gloeocapsa sp. PCC 73106 TaxID=102232 RepID=UPI0002AC8773|nr:hypothetical protein [Gloeocapsa sp. PCC 73106]ELR98172.1 hypothetical protein GLO73106DRAFT_00019990 [Gloeocapsa sp. PCC 73106]